MGCFGIPEIEEGQTYTLNADRRCTYKVNFWNRTAVREGLSRKLLFDYIGQEIPVQTDEDGFFEYDSLVPYSPYEDEVFYWVTPQRLEILAGQTQVDRNNVMDMRNP